MESRDYVAEISDQFTGLDFAQQASFSLAAVVLFDTAWSRAANELLDENKAELSGFFKAEIDSAICCGDSTCKVSVKKTAK